MADNFLAELDAVDDKEKQLLINHWIREKPLPFFKQLREQRPIVETPECVLVSRYQDVCHLLKTPDIFTTQLYFNNIYTSSRNLGHFFAHDNNALHRREKAIIREVLNHDDISSIRHLVKVSAQKIIQQSQGSIELVGQYSRKIPVLVAQEYFGFSGANYEDLTRWAVSSQRHTFFNHPFNLYTQSQADAIAEAYSVSSKEMVVYLKKLLLKKWLAIHCADPVFAILKLGKDDVAKRLLRISHANSNDFSMLRVGINLAGLLAGSVENTSSAVIRGITFLLHNVDVLEQANILAVEKNTSGFDKMTCELLRFAPITPYLFRQASEDVVIAKGQQWETHVPKGKTVLLLIQSAMFDKDCYDNPEEFNSQRCPTPSLAFGHGIHECVGQSLAIAMITEMLRELVICKDLALQQAVDFKGGPFPECCQLTWRCVD